MIPPLQLRKIDSQRRRAVGRRTQALCLLALILPSVAGCWGSSQSEVVTYVALDSEFSEPILAEFSRETGVRALPKFDIESTKTVGLTEAIIAERARPRCDVFWNNEILHTLRLEKLGLLESYDSPAAADFPAMYRSPRGLWYGFAARARVLIVNTEKIPADKRPRSIHDLVAPSGPVRSGWPSRCSVPRPRTPRACSSSGGTRRPGSFSASSNSRPRSSAATSKWPKRSRRASWPSA